MNKGMTDSVSEDLRERRHSAAHVLADALCRIFPGTKLAIGPPTEEGFYYDVEIPGGISEADLPRVEEVMREIIRADLPFEYREVSADEARRLFAEQPYKLELIERILAGDSDADGNVVEGPRVLSVYTHGGFTDLCRGPHAKHTGNLDPAATKLLRIAGAYWRGDERRPMLQRIYGTTWENRQDLEDYLWRVEEAKRRDHRRIGEDLDLFTFSEEIGRGLPLWMPKGTLIREELENWAKKTERERGYERVVTPHLAKSELYRISGHLPYYTADLYAPIDIEGDEYYLRPMNCPHHHMIYKARRRSYRELPIRYAEYGTVYRYESSGQLHGLMRTRGFTQNDAHIYCRREDAKREFTEVMRLHDHYYRILGLKDYHMVLALRDPKNTKKYHGDAAMWAEAERLTREAMEESGIPYTEEIGSAAHYGPKVDFIIRSVTGKEFAAATNQLDLYMPERFDLKYIDASGREEYVAVLHRAPLGSHERFVAFLIEYYAGAFPVWLAPVQARFIAVADRHSQFATKIAEELRRFDFRVDVDSSAERMQAKIRKAQLEKIPYMLVVGDREVAAGSVSVRLRTGETLAAMPVAEFQDLLRRIVETKSLQLH
jgi:threonyl-tRNA synthetase